MDVVLWILSGLLAVMFIGVGSMKVFVPKEKVQENPRMAWVNDFSQMQLRIIGVLEMLGGIGLVLPKLTNILPFLTPLAAGGLILTMVGAMITHLRRKEYPQIGANAVLFVLLGIVLLSNLPLLTA
jgi:uncharacterized membrane protein YphA (DoxX/SURF4 family)